MEYEEMAIINHVTVGLRDVDRPILWFDVSMLSGSALIAYEWEDAGEFLRINKITNISNLEGKPCIVAIEDGNVIVKRLFTP